MTSTEIRRQQLVAELCGASVRAMAGDPRLHFRAGVLHRDEEPFPASAAHLRPAAGSDDFGSFRGASDGLALRSRHSDADLHRSLRPADPAAALVFELLEQFRVESLAELPGIVGNLRHRHRTWSMAFHESGLTETHTGLLLFTVAQIARSRVCGQPVVAATEDLIEATRFALAPAIGAELAALRRHRADQTAYAGPALAVAERVAALVDQAGADAPEAAAATRSAFRLLLDDPDGGDAAEGAAYGRSPVLARSGGYRVFTRAYDRCRSGADLVRPARLAELRARLDDRVAGQGVNVGALARRLHRVLAAPGRDGWDDGQEEGLVDGRRLAGLIASPTERRLFRTERTQPVADAVVGLLLDCSGSMRRHHETVAMLADVLTRALDLAGVPSEVLGFTTGAWNGGRALRDWRRAGRPAAPGRLNEVLHLVLKDADTPWRTARRGIAALLKDDLYREGVDGEAVAWAAARLAARPEPRRILVVLSDGSPMDAATHLANDPHYLDHHLRQVLAAERARGAVRVLGLGVGADLGGAFEESRVLDLDSPDTVANAAFDEVLALLAGRRRR